MPLFVFVAAPCAIPPGRGLFDNLMAVIAIVWPVLVTLVNHGWRDTWRKFAARRATDADARSGF